MPCVGHEYELMDKMNSKAIYSQFDFSNCVRNFRVCVVTQEGLILQAQTIRELKSTGKIDTATLGILQTSSKEQVAACLSATYIGSTTTSWRFEGWETKNGFTTKIGTMSKAALDNKDVPAKLLLNYIYKMYENGR